MKIGIVGNTSKENIDSIVFQLISKLEEYNLEFVISDMLKNFLKKEKVEDFKFVSHERIYNISDLVLSIGGDGTMLNTAYEARYQSTPLLGVNLGKLGFLAEFDIDQMDRIIKDIKEEKYEISQRIALEARILNGTDEQLYAINDFVIDKGRWPKMIELTLMVDDQYVTSFSADGVIVATPTGSTGYSMSVGGPIIAPKANVIVISPISPHTLTMRPFVLSSRQVLRVKVDSPYKQVQINSDGQRVNDFNTPYEIEIRQSANPVRLVHTSAVNYFEILRNKLYWGIDVRNKNK